MKDPKAHPFFTDVDIERLTSETFDARLEQSADQIVGIFFWGHDCPNCEVAKNMLHQEHEQLNKLGLKWFHVNVYENFDLGTRFGLHGIPTFVFFHNGKRLGKISPFPGIEPFFEALHRLKASES